MDTLVLNLHKEHFDNISKGTKTTEYRDVQPYWTARLFDSKTGNRKPFKYIEFRNGYQTNPPIMITEFLGFSTRNGKYCIRIGKVLKRRNFRK